MLCFVVFHCVVSSSYPATSKQKCFKLLYGFLQYQYVQAAFSPSFTSVLISVLLILCVTHKEFNLVCKSVLSIRTAWEAKWNTMMLAWLHQ